MAQREQLSPHIADTRGDYFVRRAGTVEAFHDRRNIVHQRLKAGYWGAWQFDDGMYTRDFEGRKYNVDGIEIQIVGSQTKDTWSGDGTLSTSRKLRISGQAVLTAQEAQDIASAIWEKSRPCRDSTARTTATETMMRTRCVVYETPG